MGGAAEGGVINLALIVAEERRCPLGIGAFSILARETDSLEAKLRMANLGCEQSSRLKGHGLVRESVYM